LHLLDYHQEAYLCQSPVLRFRKALKDYQKAESLKVTGTLNKLTLEKMNIPLTDKQKAM
jgi:hypothetical protein